jgi:peptide/nickel transport system substrate-binding protein
MTREQASGDAAGRGGETDRSVSRARRHQVGVLGLALLAATALLAAGCGTNNAGDQAAAPDADTSRQYVNETVSSDAPATGGQIVYGIPAETGSFNPVLAGWASYSLTIARTIYDTLAIYDEKGEVQPYLAQSFAHNADYTEWTVTLRDGVSYTNGKPVTAESVAGFQRAVKASPVLSETFARADSWEVKDRLTFVVKTNQPWTSYPHAMTSQIGVAVDPDWLTSQDITHPIGTGPFIVDHWDVDKEMVLKKNPNYWRKDERGVAFPYLDQLTFRIIVDETARVEALRKGTIDIMMQTYSTPSVGEMLTEAKSGTFQAFSDKRFETPEDYILVNTTKPPLDDVDARRALASALDLNDYVAKVTGGLDEPADSPWKPGSPWYTPITDYPKYDVAEAKRLIDKVKAKNGGQFTVTLLGNPSNESIRIQQYVQEQWTKVGVEVVLESKPQQTKIIKMLQGDDDLVLTQQWDNVHPYNEVVYWQDWKKPLGTISINFSRLNDPKITQLAIEASGTTGAVEKEKYAGLAKRFAELVPYIWLAHASRTVIAKPRLVNVVRAKLPGGQAMLEFIQGSHALDQVWLRR